MDIKHVDPDDEDLPRHPRQVVLMFDRYFFEHNPTFYVAPYELLTEGEVAAIREYSADYTPDEYLLGFHEHTPVTRKVQAVVNRIHEKGKEVSVSALADYEIKLSFEV